MSDKLPAPCEHCKATGFFGGSVCRECDGKGFRLIVDGRVIPQKFEKGMLAAVHKPANANRGRSSAF